MKYLCLGYIDYDRFDQLSESEKEELLTVCYAQCIPFRETGKVVAEKALQNVSKAKSIRPRQGRPTVTDGPFAETREQIGSFFIVEADSIDEAIEIASIHPAALMGEQYGFGIELRPIA